MAKRKRGNKVLGAILNATPKALKPTVKKVIKGVPGQVKRGKKLVGNEFNTFMFGKKYKGKKRK